MVRGIEIDLAHKVRLRDCEQVVLALLAGPHDPRELLAARGASGCSVRPPPGEGWVPYGYVTSRVGLVVRLPAHSRLNHIGDAVRSLWAKGLIDVAYARMRDGKKRVLWARL